MTQQHTDNVLFSLDGKDVMRNRKKFEAGVKFAEAGHKAMAYYAGDGHGRLTEGASRHLAEFIKACILDKSLLEGRDAAWKPLSTKYSQRKRNRYGGSALDFWHLYGNIYDNIDIIWRGKYTRTIGIKRSEEATRPSGRGTYKIAQVAKILEFGGGEIPARPLFGAASSIFLQKHFPEWGNAAMEIFSKTYMQHFKDIQDNAEANLLSKLELNTQKELSRYMSFKGLDSAQISSVKAAFRK